MDDGMRARGEVLALMHEHVVAFEREIMSAFSRG
jgi:hypothetical protein